MALVKVWNDNIHDHTETFKGEKIHIPAGSYIEMDWEEATEFRGQFTGVAPLGPDGKPDARFFKMIRVERPAQPVFKDDAHVNHADGKKYDSVKELLAALEDYKDRRVVDSDLERELEKQGKGMKSELDALKAQVAELTALLVRKTKPGKAKEA